MTEYLKQIVKYAEERLAGYCISQNTDCILESIARAVDQSDDNAMQYFIKEYSTCTVSFRSLWATPKEREDFFLNYLVNSVRTRKETGGYEQHIINIINRIKR